MIPGDHLTADDFEPLDAAFLERIEEDNDAFFKRLCEEGVFDDAFLKRFCEEDVVDGGGDPQVLGSAAAGGGSDTM